MNQRSVWREWSGDHFMIHYSKGVFPMAGEAEAVALVSIIVPAELDPARYVDDAIKSGVRYHFTQTSESAALTIEQQKARIVELEGHLTRLMARRSQVERDGYILRLHKADLRRIERAGGVSVQLCQYCHALIVADYLLVHEEQCLLNPTEE